MSINTVYDFFTNSVFAESVTPKKVLEKALLAGGALFNKKDPIFSGHSLGTTFLVSDYTSLYHSFEDLGLSIQAFFPNNPMHGFLSHFQSKDMMIGSHTFGSVTGVNAIIGLVEMFHLRCGIQFANQIGDKRGSLMGKVGLLQEASLGVTGISGGAFRVLSTVGTIKDVQVGSLMNRVSDGLVLIGIVFYALFFAFLSAVTGIRAYEGSQFKKKLRGADGLAEKIEVLQKKSSADAKKVYEKELARFGSEAKLKSELIEEGYKAGAENLKKALKELGHEKISDEKLREMIHSSLEESVGGWTSAGIQTRVEESLKQLGLEAKVEKVQRKKEEKMDRILSQSGLKALNKIKNDHNLVSRIQKGDKEAIEKGKKLAKIVKKSNQKKLTESAALIAISIIGILVMGASIVLTGGLGLIVASAILLVFSGLMTGIDGYFLYQSYKGELLAQHDKKLLIVSSILGLSSFLTMAALGLSGVVSMGTVPIIIALVLAAMWIGQNGATFAMMNRNQRRDEEKDPTLEALLKAHEKGNVKRIEKMMKNLSEARRKFLKGTDVESVRKAIKKVEEVKKERLESLREAVAPHLVRVSAS